MENEEFENIEMDDASLIELTCTLSNLGKRYLKLKGGCANPLQGQGKVLTLLLNRPYTTQKELSQTLDMRQQSLSELLIKLENKGLVKREKSDKDRRVICISLTDEGANIAQDIKENTQSITFESLSDEEIIQYNNLCMRAIEEIEDKLIDLGDELTMQNRNRRCMRANNMGCARRQRHQRRKMCENRCEKEEMQVCDHTQKRMRGFANEEI